MTREQQQRTKIKICGLKRPEDITYVNEAKPDYCGFIIEFPKSSRNVTGVQVRELTARLASDIIPVGVFVNVAPERVEELLLDGTIHIAQLHGQEDEAYIRRIQKNTGHQVIKAFSVKTAQDIENALKSPADYILLDQGGGGTIAYILANYGMSVIDSGVAVLNMHAPWELISKVDLYEAYNGYVAFLKEA
mgnify:CR=1 FL=1